MSEPEKLGDILARSKVGNPKKKKLRLELIKLNWTPLVGERIGKHSRPTRLSKGTLTTTADGAAWAAELSMKSGEVIRGIEKLLGEAAVKMIKVQSRKPEGEDAGETSSGGEGLEDGEEVVVIDGKIMQELSRLSDEEVRKALLRLLRAGKASKQYNQDSA